MDKIHLVDIGRNGEDTLKDVKDTVFTLISKNRNIYSDIKKLAGYKTTKISFEAKIKEDILQIMKDSKSLMFAVQLMKLTKSAEVTIDDTKFEVLSITCPTAQQRDLDTDRLTVELLIQKTKFGQINIHKALVDISLLSVKTLPKTKADLKFETKLKINNAETQASITIYFVLKSLSLIFGNYDLFSTNLITDTSDLSCMVLLPQQYMKDENKRKYTLNYIKKAINYLIQQSIQLEKVNDEAVTKWNKKENDHINRLLMLGVSPSTVKHLRKYLGSAEKKNLEDENIRAITSVNEEENLYQTKGKLRYT